MQCILASDNHATSPIVKGLGSYGKQKIRSEEGGGRGKDQKYDIFSSNLKGTVAWDGLFAHSIRYCIERWVYDLNFFGFGRKFSAIGSVLSLSEYSPYTAKYSSRILLIRLYALGVFSMKAKWTLKGFYRNDQIQLNTLSYSPTTIKTHFSFFRNTYKELKIRWNMFALLKMPGDFKGTLYRKNWLGLYILA